MSLFPVATATAGENPSLPAALNLPDDELFADKPNPKLEARLLDSKFVGVALRAPARVDVGKQSVLPLLVVSRFDGARDWDFPLHDLGWLVGVERGSGKVRLASAFGSTKRPAPSQRGPRPAADELAGFGAQLNRIEARARLDIPWQPGCWTFFLVYYDWISNVVGVRLDKLGKAQAKPNVACAPPSSDRDNVDFSIVRAPDGTARVEGRYSLPVHAQAEAPKDLSATLLIATPNGAMPERVDWQIPVKPRPGMRTVGGKLVHGFSLKAEPVAGAVVYLIVGGRVVGPRPWGAQASGR